MTGAERIAAERARQVQVEGYAAVHDDNYHGHQLAWAAACYAAPQRIYKLESNAYDSLEFYEPWPWDPIHDKRTPGGDGLQDGTRVGVDLLVVLGTERIDLRMVELAKAGALLAAEIDRLERLKARTLARGGA